MSPVSLLRNIALRPVVAVILVLLVVTLPFFAVVRGKEELTPTLRSQFPLSFVVSDLAIFKDQGVLAADNAHNAVVLWDVTASAGPRRLASVDRSGQVTSVAFSSNTPIFATGGIDGTVILSDVTNPQIPSRLSSFISNSGSVTFVAISLDGRTLATGGTDSIVNLWDATDPGNVKLLGALTGHTNRVTSVAFSPDAHILATGSTDNTARIWDVTDPRHLRSLGVLVTSSSVKPVTFSPDGHTLATGDANGFTQLWNVTDPGYPHLLSALDGHSGPVTAVRFLRMGRPWLLAAQTRQLCCGVIFQDRFQGAQVWVGPT